MCVLDHCVITVLLVLLFACCRNLVDRRKRGGYGEIPARHRNPTKIPVMQLNWQNAEEVETESHLSRKVSVES